MLIERAHRAHHSGHNMALPRPSRIGSRNHESTKIGIGTLVKKSEEVWNWYFYENRCFEICHSNFGMVWNPKKPYSEVTSRPSPNPPPTCPPTVIYPTRCFFPIVIPYILSPLQPPRVAVVFIYILSPLRPSGVAVASLYILSPLQLPRVSLLALPMVISIHTPRSGYWKSDATLNRHRAPLNPSPYIVDTPI